MFLKFFSNPIILATISAAVIGSFTAWILSTVTERYKFNKRKMGAYALLKSDIFLYIKSLKEYEENYLKNDKNNVNDEKYHEELKNFYINLKFFPKYKNEKWDELTTFIPSILNPDQIIQISKFNLNYKKLNSTSINLSKKKLQNRK